MPDQAVVEESKRIIGRVVGREIAREAFAFGNLHLLTRYWTLTIQEGKEGPEVLIVENEGKGRTVRINKKNLSKEIREK